MVIRRWGAVGGLALGDAVEDGALFVGHVHRETESPIFAVDRSDEARLPFAFHGAIVGFLKLCPEFVFAQVKIGRAHDRVSAERPRG
jgi:hypothetical protein